MNPKLASLFAFLWKEYVAVTPQAKRIHALLEERGEVICNDHIALRTFGYREMGVEKLAQPFLEHGYEETGEYAFPEKKLRAKSYSLPGAIAPRVFISELEMDQVSLSMQKRIDALTEPLRRLLLSGEALLRQQPSWAPVPYDMYVELHAESEYAAWLAAMGLRANHFTVSVNRLETFTGLLELNDFLRREGFELNGSGTQIQGSKDVYLEQSSTLADTISWVFREGVYEIRSCYYEFAKRYINPSTGELFDGFVTTSADKIFESTNRDEPSRSLKSESIT